MINIDRNKIAARIDQLGFSFAIGAIILAVFILILRVIIHFPFFDESLHLHYLWLVANGYIPGKDFYCHYPPLAYFCLIPYINLFPDSAYVVLALRYTSLAIYLGIGGLFYFHGRRVANDWCIAVMPLVLLASASNIGPFMVEYSVDPLAAVTAVGAMLIFFRTPTERTVAISAGLSLLSVLFTPKYAFPLFFGLIGHSAAYVWASREKIKTVRAICIGGAASLAFVLPIFWLNGVSFLDIQATTLITSKTVQIMNGILSYSFLVHRLLDKPVYIAVIVLGLLGWVLRSRGRIDQITLSGAGILLGLILFFITICLPLEQYQMPVYVSLEMFAPFTFAALGDKLWVKILRSGMFVVVFFVVANKYPVLVQEFMGTSVYTRDANNTRLPKGPTAIKALSEIDQLLRVVPRDEKVVALWPNSPLFRKDLTGITWDENPSYSEVLSKDNPNAAFFDPKNYQAALAGHLPALIDLGLLQTNYPPQWYEITVDFLVRNKASYVYLPSKVVPGTFYYLRRDLQQPQ